MSPRNSNEKVLKSLMGSFSMAAADASPVLSIEFTTDETTVARIGMLSLRNISKLGRAFLQKVQKPSQPLMTFRPSSSVIVTVDVAAATAAGVDKLDLVDPLPPFLSPFFLPLYLLCHPLPTDTPKRPSLLPQNQAHQCASSCIAHRTDSDQQHEVHGVFSRFSVLGGSSDTFPGAAGGFFGGFGGFGGLSPFPPGLDGGSVFGAASAS